ncbi:hypothetical protein QN277_009105 [Acacia crassicarpa]|uniref:Uncharacterized protein n=1 Tax=Acacia crassicarpa TaxID=499986 RepID=A0AAE1M8X1_9FABA|nr:hypothetical protein QN277_009105 [Acacia crassicarpa]
MASERACIYYYLLPKSELSLFSFRSFRFSLNPLFSPPIPVNTVQDSLPLVVTRGGELGGSSSATPRAARGCGSLSPLFR